MGGATDVVAPVQNTQLLRATRPKNTAHVQKGNKKKILVLKPSARVAFESPFKTALNVQKKSKQDTVWLIKDAFIFEYLLCTLWSNKNLIKILFLPKYFWIFQPIKVKFPGKISHNLRNLSQYFQLNRFCRSKVNNCWVEVVREFFEENKKASIDTAI